MKTTIEIWKELVTSVTELKLFKAVLAYPLNRVMDAAFLKNLEAFELPACLIIWDGRADTIEFQAYTREADWIAVIAAKDPGGAAYEETTRLMDQLTDKMLFHTLFDKTVEILGTHTADAESSGPRLSVITLRFKTRQRVKTPGAA